MKDLFNLIKFSNSFLDLNKKKIIFFCLVSLLISVLNLFGIASFAILIGALVNNQTGFYLLENININLNDKFYYFFSTLLLLSLTIKTIISYILQIQISKFTAKKEHESRVKILKNFLFVGYKEYVKFNSSKLLLSVNNILTTYFRSIKITFIAFGELATGIILLLFLTIYDWKFTFVFSVYFLIIFFIYDLIFKKQFSLIGKNENYSKQSLLMLTNNFFKSFKEVKIFNKEKFYINLLSEKSELLKQTSIKNQVYTQIIIPTFEISGIIFLFGILYYFYLIGINFEKFIVQIVVFLFTLNRLRPIFQNLISVYNRARIVKDTIERLKEILNFTKKNQNIEKYKDSEKNFKKIELKNISFNYETNQIFKNLNLEIHNNEKIFVHGPSGSGKTTLMNIIMGLYDDYQGNIFLNNNEIKKNTKFLEIFSYVTQHPIIFNGSILENITFESDITNINNTKYINSLQNSGLNNFLADSKFDFEIEENGQNLSGGQKQRIAIARAIYHDKPFFICDEPTTGLDKKLEDEVLNNLLKINKTIIIISHNNLNHNFFDKIYKIENQTLKKIK